jgi:hypothetical protein
MVEWHPLGQAVAEPSFRGLPQAGPRNPKLSTLNWIPGSAFRRPGMTPQAPSHFSRFNGYTFSGPGNERLRTSSA